MPACPTNVQRLVAERDKLVSAKNYADSITLGSVTAAWHEQPVKRALGAVTVSDSLHASSVPVHSAPNTREQQKREAEAFAAARKHALALRQARMRQLFEEDAAAQQRELAQSGLSLLPPVL